MVPNIMACLCTAYNQIVVIVAVAICLAFSQTVLCTVRQIVRTVMRPTRRMRNDIDMNIIYMSATNSLV